MKTLPLLFLLGCILASELPAQCGGNGGAGDLQTSPLIPGTTVTIRVSGGANAPFGLYLSGSIAPVQLPVFGSLCINLQDPLLLLLAQGALSPSGSFDLPIPIPNDPGLLAAVAYLQAGVADPLHPSGLAISPALRVDFEGADTYATLPSLSIPRALATATALRDGRVLIAGGGNGSLLSPVGTDSAELYDPVTRSLSNAGLMVSSRALHAATLLLDGRVLLSGGIGDVLGNGTASCEVFDPATNTFLPVAGMGAARAGHAATRLLDGRVLVVGGLPSFVGGTTNLQAVLNASLDTGEVYDPVANTWTPVANAMSSRRFLPSLETLANGTSLAISGISGASSLFGQAIPNFTATTDAYSAISNTFTPSATIGSGQGRAGASSLVLPNGNILVAGGVAAGLLGIPSATNTMRVFNGTSFIAGPNMQAAAALPGLVLLQSGQVLLAGGVNGTLLAPTSTNQVSVYTGTNVVGLPPLPGERGAHVVARLKDGGVLIAGGGDASGTAQADAWLLTPNH